MDISRLKKVLVGASVAALSFAGVASVMAKYTDVPSGIWYEDAVDAFLDAGYLDASQARFRGGDLANRAEFVKLVVELNGGILSTPPAVGTFNDVKASAWYYGYFEEAAKEQWVRGDNNCAGSHPCYARPSANINRAEAAALIVRAFALEATGDAPRFVDNPNGQWYTDVIQTAADHCVLQGDDNRGTVRPADNMNRAEMVTMLHRVDQGLTYGVDCGTGQTGEAAITNVVATSATTIEVEFNRELDSTSAEDASVYSVTAGSTEVNVDSASLIDASTVELTLATPLEAGKEYTVSVNDLETADGDMFSDSDTVVYNALPKGEGELEVSVASSNPTGDTVPRGAVGVVMLSLDLTASCKDDVVLESVTVLHEGFGNTSDIDGVYASIDGGRVTRKRTFDSESQTADVRFSTPLMIHKCDTQTVDFVADFNSTATVSAEHNFVVELPSDFQGNAQDVSGNFPARGNTFRIAAVTSGKVTVAYRTVTPDEINVGDTSKVIGKFELTADSVEDQTIYSVTLEQDGSASDGDIQQIRIRRSDGTVLTNTVAQTNGDFVTLVFDPPFTVKEGDRVTLEVIGNVEGGAGENIKMHFEESSDLFAVGSLYGYGVNGQLYGSQVVLPTETATLPSTVTISAGEFTVEINGPAQKSYTRDADDVVFANVIFTTGGGQVDVRDLFFAIEGETSTGASFTVSGGVSTADNIHEVLEDVELHSTKTGRTISAVRLTGATDFSSSAPGSNKGTYQVYRADDFVIDGKETFEVRADFIDNGSTAGLHPQNGDQFKVHVCGEPKKISSAGSSIANTTGCDFGGLLSSASTSYQMDLEDVVTGEQIDDVRPRGDIAGTFQRIATANLTLAVKNIGTSDTYVKNAKNVDILRLEARAGEAEDLLLTTLIFESSSGSLNNGQNYTLWMDKDGDGKVETIVQSGEAAQNSKVTFDDFKGGGATVPAEHTVIFEVHTDIASTLTNGDLQIRLASGSTYVEAEEVDDGTSLSGIRTLQPDGSAESGTCSTNCDIIVQTVYSINLALANQGDLFVTKDSESLRNHQYLGGTLGDTALQLQFHAENEPIDVTDLQITSSGSSVNSVDRLELYKFNGSTLESNYFALATVGGCGTDDVTGGTNRVTFCANMDSRQLVIPEGKDVRVAVKPRMKTDVDGAVSQETIAFWINSQPQANFATGSGAVRARGADSSNNLGRNNGNSGASSGAVFIGRTTAGGANAHIFGQVNQSMLARIDSIVNDNIDGAGPRSVPVGVSEVGAFKITAAPHNNTKDGLNDIILSGVIFNVNATNVSIANGSLKLYVKGNSTSSFTCTGITSAGGVTLANAYSGTFLANCDLRAGTSSVNTEIDQATSKTYVLQANISNPQIVGTNTSTLQVSLTDFTNIANTSFAYNASHLVYEDKDSSTDKGFYWVESADTTVKSTNYQS
jgi:hypothetical protein